MDDLNKKRLEKGQRLSFFGRDEDEIDDLLTNAVKAYGYNGRTYSGPQNNPVGPYRRSRWLPFGAEHGYDAPTEVAKLLGYQLIHTQRDGDWFHLYFDAQEDRGGCYRRVDIFDGEVMGICRSDLLDEGLLDPLSGFTRVLSETLTGVAAFRSGRIVLRFETAEIDRQWDCPLDADKEPEAGPVLYVERKANFERVLIATLHHHRQEEL